MEHFDHEEHSHHHEHTHSADAGPHAHTEADSHEQTLAVLRYMLDHNIHHAAELKELAGQLTGEAKHQMLHAVESFEHANEYLAGALKELSK